jgi:hypothetical protein
MTSKVPPDHHDPFGNRPSRNWRTIGVRALVCIIVFVVPLCVVTCLLMTAWAMSQADDPGPAIPLFLLGAWVLLLVLACRWIFKRPPR